MMLVLPEPPSANRYYRTRVARTRLGKAYVQTYKSPEARRYQADVQVRATVTGMRPIDGPVRLIVRWFRARKAGDVTNRLKVLEDALIGVAYHDDSQVIEATIARFDDRLNPRAEVEILT